MLKMEISEVSKLTNLKAHTLRYYEDIGLVKAIKRNSSGKRIYSEEDLRWLEVIIRLRKTGMNINDMREYARLRNLGDETISARKNIMETHLISIEHEIERLLEAKDYVSKKIQIYNEMERKLDARRK